MKIPFSIFIFCCKALDFFRLKECNHEFISYVGNSLSQWNAGVYRNIYRKEILGLLGPSPARKTTPPSPCCRPCNVRTPRARTPDTTPSLEAAKVRELISLTGQYASMDESLTAAGEPSAFGRLTGLRAALKTRIDDLADQFDSADVRTRRVGALSGGMPSRRHRRRPHHPGPMRCSSTSRPLVSIRVAARRCGIASSRVCVPKASPFC